MRKHFFTLFISLVAVTAFAAVGPQSIRVTFNGDNAEGWVASSGGSITSVADGVANVQMAKQSNDKYRADFQYNTAGFTMDKSKDVVWAIKLTTVLPGTANNRKFEIQYNDGSDKWINGITGPSGDLTCADGGKIYYFNLGADGLNKLSGLPEGEITVKQIHYIFADATELTDETAKYSVDWIASFASLNDLKSFANWDDDKELGGEAYFEILFRPNSAGTGYDSGTPKTSFETANVEFEGNYKAGLFAVEYFLVENFNVAANYEFVLTATGSNTNDLSVWDFPYQVNSFETASDIITKATAVVGIAPRATEGDIKEPIASADIDGGAWTFTIPGYKLSVLATQGNKSLVGLLVSSKEAKTDDRKGKFASASHTTVAHPSLTYAGINAIINTTNVDKKQWSAYATLAAAVTAASANDVITLFGDITISGSRQEITKALTIQGATGEEKIMCGVAANSLMVLVNGNTESYTVTFKNLVVDGQNTLRSTQTFDTNNKGIICFDGVIVINTSYSVVTGDAKCNGDKIILKGMNSFLNGIYLNKGKRIDHQSATHTDPIKITLASDYAEDYAIILTCNDPSKYNVVDAAGAKGWLLYVDNNELKGKNCLQYDLEVKAAAKMATMVIGFDAELPEGVKAYQLVYDDSPEYADGICAYEESSISKNKPVLIIAEPGTYSFKSVADATLDEQPNPEYGALKGVYASGYIPACSAGVYNYALTNGSDGVGFYQVADASNAIGAHRAYLSCGYDTQAGGGSAPRRMVINFDAHKTPTAIEQITKDQRPITNKVLINGVIYIRKADNLYRIDGQLVK